MKRFASRPTVLGPVQPLVSLAVSTAVSTAVPLAVLALAVLGAISPLVAQSDARSLGPRSFFPKEYTAEYYLDFDSLLDTELWEQFERSMIAGPMRTMFRSEFGFRLEEIRRVRSAWRFLGEGESKTAEPREVGVTVIEGTKKLSLPRVGETKPGEYLVLSKEQIAGYDVVREAPSEQFSAWAEARLYVMPKPGCLVIGSEEMIRTALEGERRGGVISSRLMALTAAKRRPIAYLAVGFPPPDDPRYLRQVGFDPNWMDEDDPLQHLVARLEIDEKSGDAKVRATLRFKTGKRGPAKLEEGIKASLEGMKRQSTFTLIEPYLESLKWRRDGEDLDVSIAVTPKYIGSLLGAGGLASYFLMAQAAPVAVAPAPVAAPLAVPAAKKPPPKKPTSKETTKKATSRKTKKAATGRSASPGRPGATKPTSRPTKPKKRS